MIAFLRPKYVVIPERNKMAVPDVIVRISSQDHKRSGRPCVQLKFKRRIFRLFLKTAEGDYYLRHAYPSVRHSG